MNYERLFAGFGDRVVRAGLIGVGQFGASLIAQANAIPLLSLPAICDRDVDQALAACRANGITDVLVCENDAEANRALVD